MSVGLTTGAALAIGGLASAAGGVASGLLGSSAATSAASTQAQSDANAITEQQREFNIAQGNSAPFVSAGQTSIAQIMAGLQNGTFGPGSVPAFTAPTLADAQNTPGYQFTAQQGSKGILQGAAAAGGAISGGTLKALDSFNTGLADSTYNDVYSRALSTYGANLTGQQQAFSQLLAPAQIGSGAASSINQTGSTAATNIAGLMQAQGSATASGTLGSANSIAGGINSATNGILNSVLLGNVLGGGKAIPGNPTLEGQNPIPPIQYTPPPG